MTNRGRVQRERSGGDRPARVLGLWMTVILAAVITGCGSSGGSSGGSAGASAGATKGTITGFGSVILDDLRLETSSASVSIDDSGGGEDDLRKGMVIRARGVIADGGASGTASSIEYDQELEGPVASLDAASSSFVVLGRTVIVDRNTIIKDESASRAADDANPQLALSDLAGRMVEVSGYLASDGTLLATRVERKPGSFVPGSTLVEIKGTITGYDGGTSSFTLGTLVIDFSGVIPDGALGDGVTVEVKGTLASAGATTLIATSVEVEDDGAGAGAGETIEVEGLVTSFTSATEFSVDGQPVEAGAAEYRNGDKADVALDVHLEVEGTLVGGVLQAREVTFKGSRVKMEGTITAYAAPYLTIFGLDVRTNAFTEVTGVLGTGTARIRGYVTGGEVVATQVVMTAVSDEILQGPVDGGSVVGTTSFAILGITVDTAGVLETAFKGEEDVQIGRAAFFSLLGAGRVVKAQGSFAGSTLTATEVEVDD